MWWFLSDETIVHVHVKIHVEAVVSVTVCICLQTLLMAHALRRVSLSTARPIDAQFAFVSHNPGNTDAQLYCHVFQARHARAVRNDRCHCSFTTTKENRSTIIKRESQLRLQKDDLLLTLWPYKEVYL